MKTIYFTFGNLGGLFLTERGGGVQSLSATTETEIKEHLGKIRPDHQYIHLSEPEFWRKVSEERPQPTDRDLALLGQGSSYMEEPYSDSDFYDFY